MIWSYLLLFISAFLTDIPVFLHFPRIETLPFGMDEPLVTAFGNFNAFMDMFPPLHITFVAFMIYLGFRVAVLVLNNIPFINFKI